MIQIDPGFQPRALADEYQISRPIVGQLARLFGARALPNMERQGLSVMEATRRALDDTIAGVRDGREPAVLPVGPPAAAVTWRRSARPAAPRSSRRPSPTRASCWSGSPASGAAATACAFDGRMPGVVATTLRGLKYLLLNGVFFMPRRHVLIEFEEPADFPRQRVADGDQRATSRRSTTCARRGTLTCRTASGRRAGCRSGRSPRCTGSRATPREVPEATRRIVFEELTRLTGSSEMSARRSAGPGPRSRQPGSGGTGAVDREGVRVPGRHAREPGHRRRRRPGGLGQGHLGDRVGAAAGEPGVAGRARRRADRRWPPGATITEVFLAQAARQPGPARARRPGERRGDVPPARPRPAADGAADPRSCPAGTSASCCRRRSAPGCSTWPRCSPARRR